MRREVRLAWAGANVVLALTLVASLLVATNLTIPLLVVAVVLNVAGSVLRSG